MSATETCQSILKAARRLFVKQGYTAASMRQIAEEAGVGKATIYHHFPDKKSLIMELFKQNTKHLDEYTRLVRAETDPRRRIQAAAETSLRFHFESADLMQIIRREVPGGRDQMQAGFMDFYRQYMSLLEDAILTGVEQNTFRNVDPHEAARVLMTMIQGVFATTYLSGEKVASAEKTAAILLDVYYRGIDAG